ncbi:MAG: phospho-N-acetylmuramoyl-pentapeptide-transferase, partial [Cyclobacteriaceae bacterium]
MLYYLFDYLDKQFDLVGAGVFKYISFRAGMATAISLLITIVFGRYLINKLRDFQMGESIRDLGLEGQMQKTGTPTMGGIIIIAGIVVPTLLFAKLGNVYVQLLLLTAVSMGLIGFLDDYLKIKKKNKEGLAGHFKIIGQVAIGLIVGLVMVMHPDVTIPSYGDSSGFVDGQTINTTLPFIKNNVFKYQWFLPDFLLDFTWVIYVAVVIFIMTAVSNGANITDGLDGLAAGTSAIIGLTLAILAYLTGNIVFSEYLNIAYIPNAGELVIFSAAFVGACIGFLWSNSYPAQVFMGDTGSLS